MPAPHNRPYANAGRKELPFPSASSRACGLLGLATALAACDVAPCQDKFQIRDKNWCYCEAAADAADAGDLEAAVGYMREVSNDLIKAAAVDRILVARPPALTHDAATALCGELASVRQARCLATWDRTFVWEIR